MQTLGIPTTALEQEFAVWLAGQTETPCEYKHQPQDGFCVCSGVVTHRIVDCRDSFLACKNAAQEVVARAGRASCGKCDRYAPECWRVVPV